MNQCSTSLGHENLTIPLLRDGHIDAHHEQASLEGLAAEPHHHEYGNVFGPIDLYDLGVGPGGAVFLLLHGKGLDHPVHSLRQLSRPA